MSKRVILRLVIDLTESDDEEPKKIWEKVVCEDDAESFAGNQLPAQVHLTEKEEKHVASNASSSECASTVLISPLVTGHNGSEEDDNGSLDTVSKEIKLEDGKEDLYNIFGAFTDSSLQLFGHSQDLTGFSDLEDTWSAKDLFDDFKETASSTETTTTTTRKRTRTANSYEEVKAYERSNAKKKGVGKRKVTLLKKPNKFKPYQPYNNCYRCKLTPKDSYGCFWCIHDVPTVPWIIRENFLAECMGDDDNSDEI